MIGRRVVLRAMPALLPAWLAAPPSAGAQSVGKRFRVGYIQTATPEEQEHLTKAFIAGLREFGYVEGRNIEVEQRYAWGKQELLPGLAAELVRLNVDVIVTGANPVVSAVKQATTTIPVIMTTSRDPVGSGFIASLARPGGNITGFSSDPTPELQSKRLALLLEAVPRASRVGMLWNPLPPAAAIYAKVVEETARALGVGFQAIEVRGRDELADAFAALVRLRTDAIVVLPDPIFFTARVQVVRLATTHKLPAVFHAREFVELGGLMSYGSNLVDQFRRAAGYVDKILRGASPGELPVEQPTRFELAINMSAARSLGLEIQSALLARADEVIE